MRIRMYIHCCSKVEEPPQDMHDGIGVEGSAPGNATIKTGLSHFLVVEEPSQDVHDGIGAEGPAPGNGE